MTNFVIDLVVGDDWLIAVGVAIALGLTGVLATTTAPAWWLLPLDDRFLEHGVSVSLDMEGGRP